MNYQEHLKEFENLVHEHCNVQYNVNDGNEEIYSSMASLMIAFEEYYNKFLKPNELRAVNRNEQLKEFFPVTCFRCGEKFNDITDAEGHRCVLRKNG